MEGREIDILLRADIHEIPQLVSALERFAQASGLPEDALFRIQLALEELITNAVKYGYPDRNPGEVSIKIAHREGHVGIIFCDDAELFDPFSAPAPDRTSGVEERPLGGLGVQLVREVMDETRYCVENGRNRIDLGLTLNRLDTVG